MPLTAEQLLEIPDEDLLRAKQRYEAELELRRYARDATISLSSFVRGAWHVIEPRAELLWNWHHSLICRKLEQVSRGEISRLAICIPPGCMKSLLVSVLFPAWEWLTHPELRFQALANAAPVVARDSGKFSAVIKSEWYQRLLRAVSRNHQRLVWEAGPRWSQRTRENDATGIRISLTIGSDITGERAHWQIIDDPHDVKHVTRGTPQQIAARLRQTSDDINVTLATRVQSEDGGRFILVMQRVHANDAVAEWKRLYPEGLELVCLPMRFDPDHPDRSPDDPRTVKGELLHPAMYDEEYVQGLERALGDHASAQLQQLPIPPTGGTYRKEWMQQTYDVAPHELRVDETAIAIDANVKETAKGSNFCALVWGRRWRNRSDMSQGFDRFLLDRISGRWEHHEAKERTIALRYAWPTCTSIAIEDKANGPALASDLRQLFSGVVLVPRRSDRSKEVFNQVQGVPPFKAGEVWLPRPEHAPWIHEYRSSVARFPAEPNDDADTTSIMFMHWDGDRMKHEDDAETQLRGTLAALGFLG